MALDKQDIEQVAEKLGAQVQEMQQKNDKRLDAIESEKGALAGQVDTLTGSLAELQKEKSALEDQLNAIEMKAGRVGGGDANSPEVAEHKEAFSNFMRKGHEEGLAELQQKALETGVNADGGFAVPEELDTNLLSLLRDGNPMRQVCNVVMVGTSDYKKLVNLHGASSGWVGEKAARPATDTPKLAQIAATMGEIYANPQTTQHMLDDALFNVENWLADEVALEFAEKENAAFVNGDGSNKPKGLLQYTWEATADKTRDFGNLEKMASGSSGVVEADDIIKLIYKLKSGYRTGASFMGNTNLLAFLMTLKDGNGQYLWRPGLEVGQSSTLRGYNFVENEELPDVAAGAMSLLFGDFRRGYTIVDRMGTRVLRDPFTNKPYVGFYTTKRVGNMLTDSQAIKAIEVAA